MSGGHRALSDEQVGMILRRLSASGAGLSPAPGYPAAMADYTAGLADGMRIAYEHAAAIIGDVIGESPAPPTAAGARPVAGGVCERCRHRHTGPEMGGICVGCPCPAYGPLAW